MYTIRCNLDLGVSKDVVRSIPCARKYCIEQLELRWDKNEKDCNHQRYNVNKSCMYWNIFECLNGWNIIKLVATSKINAEKDDKEFRTILRDVETRMSEKRLKTIYGAIRIDDESIDGYYVVQWTSELYILQEYNEMKGYTPLVTVYSGEIVCDAVFLNLVPMQIMV